MSETEDPDSLLFQQADAAYIALRADPVAWEQEQEERRAWDTTLMDGLEEKDAV